MRGRGRGVQQYQLRSQQVLPFFVPRQARTPRSWRPEAVEHREVVGAPESLTTISSEEGRATEDLISVPENPSATVFIPSLREEGFVAESATDSVSDQSVASDESDIMEAPSAPVHFREQRFSGRPGTQTLREFKAFVNSLISWFRFKHGANYTAQYMFEQLPMYITDEALDFYEAHAVRLSATRQGPNPAHRQALQLAYDNRLAAAVAAHHAGVTAGTISATEPVPTMVVLTPTEMAGATPIYLWRSLCRRSLIRLMSFSRCLIMRFL